MRSDECTPFSSSSSRSSRDFERRWDPQTGRRYEERADRIASEGDPRIEEEYEGELAVVEERKGEKAETYALSSSSGKLSRDNRISRVTNEPRSNNDTAHTCVRVAYVNLKIKVSDEEEVFSSGLRLLRNIRGGLQRNSAFCGRTQMNVEITQSVYTCV